eukprot:TRINITY_DN22701_c0_g1_i1.p1 TRINITY_DN22701_c0_g1~~TRINITY_DN22701_c0_g1_i1.p1  ORF type:complete len:320 (+),score=123.78 TRINITY_DN22701_c0_g1_i1:61-1020(+)
MGDADPQPGHEAEPEEAPAATDAWGKFAEAGKSGYLQFGDAHLTQGQLECAAKMRQAGPSIRERRGRDRNLQSIVMWTSGHGDEDFWEDISDAAFSTPRAYSYYLALVLKEDRFDFLTHCIENRLSVVKPGYEEHFLGYLDEELMHMTRRDESCKADYTLPDGAYPPPVASDDLITSYCAHKKGEETEMWPAWRTEIRDVEEEGRDAVCRARDAEFEAASGGPVDVTISPYTGRKLVSIETQTDEDFTHVAGEEETAAAPEEPDAAETNEARGDEEAAAAGGDAAANDDEFLKTAKCDEDAADGSEPTAAAVAAAAAEE